MNKVPHSARYMKVLAEKYNVTYLLGKIQTREIAKQEWLERNKELLDDCFTRIEKEAAKGCIRMYIKPDDSMKRSDVAWYLKTRGFEVTPTTIEWWHESKENELH